MLVPYATFKSIISVVGTLSGCILLLRYFRYVEKDHVQNGVIVGLSWMVINLSLDAAFLMPMMKSTFPTYFMEVGISYFSIPVISIAMGLLMQRTRKPSAA